MSQDDNKTSKKKTTKATRREDIVQLGEDQDKPRGPAVNAENTKRSKERPQARSEHKPIDKPEDEGAPPVSPGATVTLNNVKIEIPTVDAEAMNLPTLGHVDFRLGRKGSAGLRMLLGGCLVSGKKIHNGHVNSSAMAMRWLLEQIADSK